MTIRCGKCHSAVWIQPGARESGSSVTCGRCGQEYVLKNWGKLRGDQRALAARARRLAKERKLDLPGAYSLLLGVATVEELRELGDADSPSCRTAPASDSRARQYDKAFQPAIDAGLLTTRQAADRGNREASAASLVSRHQLPKHVAYDVADNKISLLEAIRRRPPSEDAVHVTFGNRMLVPLVLLASLFVVIVIVAATRNAGETFVGGSEAALELGPAEVRTDSQGQIFQVLGPDPRSVLEAFCTATGRRLEPLDVVPTGRAGQRVRLGLLRDPQRPDSLRAITIHEDRVSGRWRAGEAGRALIADPAPPGAEVALRKR